MPSAPSDKTKVQMRAHKGNVPSLPQTKYCSLCPAKFTRTTHLNRHLRSHTNERLHRCNICKSSEFTRSDLLTRHKRTCGQAVNRSRRKSCEACAESKIKCNLQLPCAKCAARGRECVFRNDPEESRAKCKANSRKSARSSRVVAEDSAPPTPSPSPSPTEDPSPATSCSPCSSHFHSLPPLSESGASSDSSLQSSPRSEDFQTFDERQGQAFDFPFDVGAYGDPFPSSSTLSPISPFEEPLFPCPSPTSVFDGGKADDRALNGDDGVEEDLCLFTSYISPDPPPPPPSAPLASDPIPIPAPAPASLPMLSQNPLMAQPTVMLDCIDALDMQCRLSTSILETYLNLFFTRFLAQVPLIHAPTWKMAETPPTLVRIFHACGALFVKTPDAAAFVEATLTSVTAEISEEFSAVSDTSSSELGISCHHVHLIIALVLLQTVCLFQRESGWLDLSPSMANEHHTMLVAMIRRTGLIERVGSWTAPDWGDPSSLETAWVEWVQFATIKRTLLLAYLHDCNHCMYFASPPAFSPAELDVHLPCDEELWHAPSAADWFTVAHTPSPYGIGIDRIYGVNMQRALAALATPAPPAPAAPADSAASTPASHRPLPSFALFLLIHTVLRNICVAIAQQRASPVPPTGGAHKHSSLAAMLPPPRAPAIAGAEFTLRMQGVLDNWLQLWLLTPEAAQESESGAPVPPFVCNSLPFYWLAQVSLWENSWAAPGAPLFENVGANHTSSTTGWVA
ncbi:fungal-specific transcription factor domain-containing protein [Mycena polygramma]|nr:fungal-specific transcription factor domain-containing protein [Mycena polygramma]